MVIRQTALKGNFALASSLKLRGFEVESNAFIAKALSFLSSFAFSEPPHAEHLLHYCFFILVISLGELQLVVKINENRVGFISASAS